MGIKTDDGKDYIRSKAMNQVNDNKARGPEKDTHGTKFKPEIAVDLDGTLAYYDHWRGVNHIGEPIKLMVDRVKQWIKDGKKVVIFTARATDAEATEYVREWLEDNGIGGLEVTNTKRKEFVEFWDDRAIHVIKNTGKLLSQLMELAKEGRESSLDVQVGGGHYKDMKIQPVEFCHANKMGGIESAVVKYICRHRAKNGVQDIDKAIHLLQLLKELEYNS